MVPLSRHHRTIVRVTTTTTTTQHSTLVTLTTTAQDSSQVRGALWGVVGRQGLAGTPFAPPPTHRDGQ